MRYAIVAGWAVDFVRAARERSLLMRLLMRFAMGGYAYREFVGMMDELDRRGFIPYMEYELEHMDYHDDEVPFDWGKERLPIPKRSMTVD